MERRCSFNGCCSPVKAKTLCNQHYKQMRAGKLGETSERVRRFGCKIEGCDNPHEARGYCNKHYKQWRAGRIGKTRVRDGAQGCLVPGCPNRHEAKGFCYKHYKQWRRGTVSLDGGNNGGGNGRRKCRVIGCDAFVSRRGYCHQHLARLRQLKKSHTMARANVCEDSTVEPYEVFGFSKYADVEWNGDSDPFFERMQRSVVGVLMNLWVDEC